MKVIIVGGVAGGAPCAAFLQKKRNVRFISCCKELNAFFGTPLYL